MLSSYTGGITRAAARYGCMMYLPCSKHVCMPKLFMYSAMGSIQGSMLAQPSDAGDNAS